MLIKYAGLNQRAVAERIGLGSGAAVSMALKKLERSMGEERKWRQAHQHLDEKLRKRLRKATR